MARGHSNEIRLRVILQGQERRKGHPFKRHRLEVVSEVYLHDKASLNIFRLKDNSLDNLPDADIIAQEIVKDLEAVERDRGGSGLTCPSLALITRKPGYKRGYIIKVRTSSCKRILAVRAG